jgi:hypothetical protein
VLFVESFGVFGFSNDSALFWFEFAALGLVGISWMLEFIELFPGWFKGRVEQMTSGRSGR